MSAPESLPDCRLYVPDSKSWQVQIQRSGDRVYCFAKNPGEDYYHLIVDGEIYLQRGDEVFCLRCALRQESITTDRLFWQHRTRPEKGS